MIALQDINLEALLNKAKENEKKYEWFQASKIYEEAVDIALTIKNILEVARIQEQMGYSFFRSALQASTNKQFQHRMLQAVEAYRNTSKFFQKINDERYSAKVITSQAKAVYASSWIETDPAKKRDLLNEWWNLNSNALELFEKIGDKLAIATTCNDMMEGSMDCRYWTFPNWKESKKFRDELLSLGERALKILSKTNEAHQLARTYCWLSNYYVMNNISVAETKKEFRVKGYVYVKKALEFSKNTRDAWLEGWSLLAEYYARFDSNNSLVKKNLKHSIECGEITQDNYLTGVAKIIFIVWSYMSRFHDPDPEKNREVLKVNWALVPESIRHLEIINQVVWNPYFSSCTAFLYAALIALDIQEKKRLLKKAVEYGKKSVDVLEGYHQSNIPMMFTTYSRALYNLSKIEDNQLEKRHIIEDLIKNTVKAQKVLQAYPLNTYFLLCNQNMKIIAKAKLAEIETEKSIELLKDALLSIDPCIDAIKTYIETSPPGLYIRFLANDIYDFKLIFTKLYALTKNRDVLYLAIEIFDFVVTLFSKVEVGTGKAESFWQKAIFHNQLSEYLESAKNYRLAAEAYLEASEKTPKLKDFYNDHSQYMQAWNAIEQAKYNHSRENYLQAKNHYEKAGSLHEQISNWNYLSSNYFAWAKLEQAEESSRTDKSQVAIEDFHKAIKYFLETEINIKTKINENPIAEEKDLLTRILKASDLRQKYCQARILMEKAKLLGREGNYFDSSISYGKAAETISAILEKIDVEIERKELKYLSILCRAWEKMANAEEKTSSESYLAAAKLFEQAKEHCYTKKGSLWALGNSSFCKGLAAGLRYKTSMNLKENALAKQYIKDAASSYSEVGFRNASEYAKATLRLFDAYVFMNQAETEIDPQKKTKQYQMAENLLQIAAGSFMKAKQPEKQVQVKGILANVKEEKELAVSLSQVMQAPTITSSTLSFSAPSPTSETSVGLESFEHANVQANIVTQVKEVKVGESFCLSVEFVNAGREPALLMRVDDFVPQDFVVVKKPEIYRIEETTLNMKGKQIAPLKLVEVKLTLQASKKGNYSLNPRVQYLDEVGQNKSLQLKTLEIKVEEVLLEDRVSTGTQELDSLLLGGIPREYSVVLSGPPCDEREVMTKNFLEAGIKQGEITFYASTEATGLEELLENPNFYLFLCNPKPKTPVPDLPNVYKLQGKTDITNLGIALTKACRSINKSIDNKRICVEILSDVLVKHGVNTTREWISGLITDLGAKGFTTLAVLDTEIHAPEQSKAVLHLFDGEISIIQSDDPLDCKKSILVKKLRNQDYIKNPICLTNP